MIDVQMNGHVGKKDMLTHWINRTSARVKMSCQNSCTAPQTGPLLGNNIGTHAQSFTEYETFYCFESEVAIAHILGQNTVVACFWVLLFFGSNIVYTLSVSVLLRNSNHIAYRRSQMQWHILTVKADELYIILLFLPHFFITSFS